MTTIDSLQREGVLKLYVDFRTGTCNDLATGKIPLIQDPLTFTRQGIRSDNGLIRFTHADFNRTTFSIVFMTDFVITHAFPAYYEWICLGDCEGGSGTTPHVYLGGATANIPYGTKCFAINAAGNGNPVDWYADGKYFSTYASINLTAVDTRVTLLNYSGGGTYGWQNNTRAVLYVSRVLTADEHSKVYAELSARSWSRLV